MAYFEYILSIFLIKYIFIMNYISIFNYFNKLCSFFFCHIVWNKMNVTSSNFNSKKDFSWKKWPEFPKFFRDFVFPEWSDFDDEFEYVAKNIAGIFIL
jgi:hypothetical protein